MRYFFDAMYYGYSTGDVTAFERVAKPSECEACAKKSAQIREWSKKGTYLTPAQISEVSLETVERKDGQAGVQYEFLVSALDVVNRTDVERSYSKTKYRAIFRVKFVQNQWTVVDCAWEKVSDDHLN